MKKKFKPVVLDWIPHDGDVYVNLPALIKSFKHLFKLGKLKVIEKKTVIECLQIIEKRCKDEALK